MHKHIIWGVLGLVAGVLIGIFAVSTTPRPTDAKRPVAESKMHEFMMQSISMLSSLEGDEFDKALVTEMISHHQGAIDMAKLVIAKSKREELKNLANEIIVAQTNEILTMERWLGTWFTK